MNSKNTIPVSEARKNIFSIITDVQLPDNHFFLTERGIVKAVIMSADEYESWMETFDIMSDPELVKEIKETKKDWEKGKYEKFTTWKEMTKQLGWEINDKNSKKNVQDRSKKTGKKKSGGNR